MDHLLVSEIRAEYVDENDLQRTVTKRIWEVYDAELNQWHLKRVEYIFEDPEYPGLSDDINVAVETRHGWLIPPASDYVSETWVYTRQPANGERRGHTYDHESLVRIMR